MRSQAAIGEAYLNYFDMLAPEMLIAICDYLDPLSLYYVSLTDQSTFALARANIVWRKNVLLQVDPSRDVSKIKDHYPFFSAYMKDFYKHLSFKSRALFLWARDQDVVSLLTQSFNVAMLSLSDNHAHDCILISIAEGQPVPSRSLSALSKKHGQKPILINENGQISLFGISQRFFPLILWERTALNAEIFKAICFPPLNQISFLKPEQITPEMVQEFFVKKAHRNGVTLMKRIKTINSSQLNEYIFNQLCVELQDNKKDLIKWAIILDIDNTFFVNLLKEHDISNLYIDTNFPLVLFAVVLKSLRSMQLLLSLNADPNLAHAETLTACPLITAVKAGQLQMVELLLQAQSVVIEARDSDHATALFEAARLGHLEIVKRLYDKGANIDILCNGILPIYAALQEGRAEVVVYLLEKEAKLYVAELLPDVANKAVYTALHKGYTEALKKFFDHIHKTNYLICNKLIRFVYVRDDASTLLHMASAKGQYEFVEMLLDYGAAIDRVDALGRTALCIASLSGDEQIVALLCRYSADVNLAREGGVSPLYIAVMQKKIKAIEVLLNTGKVHIDHRLTIKEGYAPLHVAVEAGCLPIVALLLKHDAFIENKTLAGFTPAYVAIKQGHVEVLQYLINKGANIQMLFTENQHSLLHVACQFLLDVNKCKAMIKILIKAGANPLALNMEGLTPAQVASAIEIKTLMLKMEEMAEHANQAFHPYQPSYSYNRELIHQIIQEYINVHTPSGLRFQLNMNNHGVYQAQFCSVLLEHAQSDFAYCVILYAIMHVEDQNRLPALLVNMLQLTSVEEMRASLLQIISGYLCTNAGMSKVLWDTLELNVIQPILHKINRNIFYLRKNMQEYAAFDSSMLCLNVLEAKIVESMQCVIENSPRADLKRKR